MAIAIDPSNYVTVNRRLNGEQGGTSLFFFSHKGYAVQSLTVNRDKTFTLEGKGSAEDWSILVNAAIEDTFK